MKLGNQGDTIGSLAFSPVEPILASSGYFEEIHLWNFKTGEHLEKLADHKAIINLAFNAKGILAYESEGNIYIWNVVDRLLLKKIPCNEGTEIAWNPDGNTLALGSASLQLIDAATGETQRELDGNYSDSIMGISWHRNRNLLAAGGSMGDSRVRVWDLDRNSLTTSALEFAGNTQKIVFTAENEIVFIQDYAKVHMWLLSTNEVKNLFTPNNMPDKGVERSLDHACTLNPAGQIVAYSQTVGITKQINGGTYWEPINGHPLHAVYLADVRTGKAITYFEGHDEAVSCMAFSPDGKYLATGDFAGGLFVWNIE